MNEYIMPMQPIDNGRFIQNRIVDKLLDISTAHGYGLNEIAVEQYTGQERMQFAQLIGYSLSGYSDLSYVDDESYELFCALSEDTSLNEIKTRNKILKDQIKELKTIIENLYETSERM